MFRIRSDFPDPLFLWSPTDLTGLKKNQWCIKNCDFTQWKVNRIYKVRIFIWGSGFVKKIRIGTLQIESVPESIFSQPQHGVAWMELNHLQWHTGICCRNLRIAYFRDPQYEPGAAHVSALMATTAEQSKNGDVSVARHTEVNPFVANGTREINMVGLKRSLLNFVPRLWLDSVQFLRHYGYSAWGSLWDSITRMFV